MFVTTIRLQCQGFWDRVPHMMVCNCDFSHNALVFGICDCNFNHNIKVLGNVAAFVFNLLQY